MVLVYPVSLILRLSFWFILIIITPVCALRIFECTTKILKLVKIPVKLENLLHGVMSGIGNIIPKLEKIVNSSYGIVSIQQYASRCFVQNEICTLHLYLSLYILDK